MLGQLTVIISSLLMHPVHETVSELEWNAEAKRVEISLRLSVWDEAWIQKRFDAQPTDAHKDWAIRYLKANYTLDPQRSNANRIAAIDKSNNASLETKAIQSPFRYHWVGREEDGAHVWWYFEIEPKSGKQPRRVQQTMFFERNENFVNRIILLGGKQRQAIATSQRSPIASLTPKSSPSQLD